MTPTSVRIQNRYRYFRQDLRDLWESYNLVAMYMPQVHRLVRDGSLGPLTVLPLQATQPKPLSKQGTYGAIDHLRRKVNPRRVLTDGIALLEDFLGELVRFVLHDFPGRLSHGRTTEVQPREDKLLAIILESKDRAEMLDRLVEDRVRTLFYGNPGYFFRRDPAQLGFADYFNTKCPKAVNEYGEMCARRNLIIHNGGRVDRKYLQENPDTTFTIRHIVPLPPEYLHRSLALFEGLGAAAAGLTLKSAYKEAAKGKVALAWRAFERSL